MLWFFMFLFLKQPIVYKSEEQARYGYGCKSKDPLVGFLRSVMSNKSKTKNRIMTTALLSWFFYA